MRWLKRGSPWLHENQVRITRAARTNETGLCANLGLSHFEKSKASSAYPHSALGLMVYVETGLSHAIQLLLLLEKTLLLLLLLGDATVGFSHDAVDMSHSSRGEGPLA